MTTRARHRPTLLVALLLLACCALAMAPGAAFAAGTDGEPDSVTAPEGGSEAGAPEDGSETGATEDGVEAGATEDGVARRGAGTPSEDEETVADEDGADPAGSQPSQAESRSGAAGGQDADGVGEDPTSSGGREAETTHDRGQNASGAEGDAPEIAASARARAQARAARARAAARARGEAVRSLVRRRTQGARKAAQAAAGLRVRGGGGDSKRATGGGAPSGTARIGVASHGERIRLLPGRYDILVDRRALVRGYIPSARTGEKVVLEAYSGGEWRVVDTTRTIEDGKFYLEWYPRRPGYYRVRARQVRDDGNTLPSIRRLLYIYRKAMASWYGPGFYGNRTACGQTFTRELLGVAHKSLPCGKRLTVRYRGRKVTVRVVDRGPYVHGRTYDLTEATKNRIGFDGVGEIWATA